MLMTLLSIGCLGLSIWLLQESAGLTANPKRLFCALLFMVISYLCIQTQFGALRGLFILLGIISLLGPFVAFISTKKPLNKSNG